MGKLPQLGAHIWANWESIPRTQLYWEMGEKDGNPACTGSPTGRWKSGLQSDCSQLSSPAGLKTQKEKDGDQLGTLTKKKFPSFPAGKLPSEFPVGKLPLGMQHCSPPWSNLCSSQGKKLDNNRSLSNAMRTGKRDVFEPSF